MLTDTQDERLSCPPNPFSEANDTDYDGQPIKVLLSTAPVGHCVWCGSVRRSYKVDRGQEFLVIEWHCDNPTCTRREVISTQEREN